MSDIRQKLLEYGIELMQEFCTANALATPHVAVYPAERWRFKSACAYYRPTTISICPTECAHVGRAGMAWSCSLRFPVF